VSALEDAPKKQVPRSPRPVGEGLGVRSGVPGVRTFTQRGRRETTFKGKLDEPIQRWFSITPSYAPALVADCAEHLGDAPDERYLDPFSGSGTTAVWCRLNTRACTAVEWNPALHFISSVKAGWDADPDALEAAGATFAAAWAAATPDAPAAAAYLRAHPEHVPRISNPQRWWSTSSLADLAAARATLAAHPPTPAVRPGVELALLRILLEVSRARYNHASVTFAAHDDHPAPPACAVFERRLAEMVADLHAVSGRPQRLARVLRGNSLALDTVLPDPGVYTRVICSPPYPNRYSYARETRPHLFFLDLIADAAAVGALEYEAMGGTWGRATSALSRPHAPETPEVADLMAPLLDRLRAAHPLMTNYAVRYFNDFWRHVRSLDRAMAPRARMAYVVGNSKLGGVDVPVAEWILRLFEAAGWRRIGVGIHHMRRRNSRSGLVESVIFVER
jgi:hypothetical protein